MDLGAGAHRTPVAARPVVTGGDSRRRSTRQPADALGITHKLNGQSFRQATARHHRDKGAATELPLTLSAPGIARGVRRPRWHGTLRPQAWPMIATDHAALAAPRDRQLARRQRKPMSTTMSRSIAFKPGCR